MMIDYKAFLLRLSGIINISKVHMTEADLELANRALKHEFNVLGSDWQHNYYGMQTPGFEGNNYSDNSLTYEKIYETVPDFYKERQHKLLSLRKRISPEYVPVDWQIDIKSGGRYDIVHISQIRFGILDGVDAKMSADMCRFYPLVALGKAWRATHNVIYRNEIMAQILDFMTVSPPEYGAGWRGNMNVAIRIPNWLCAVALIADGLDTENNDDLEFLEEFYKSLVEHRRYVSENLEFTELKTSLHPNHYIANLSGLLCVSSFLKEFNEEDKAWENIALRELKLQTDAQVTDDGLDYEATTMYHAFALEMIYSALIISARFNKCRKACDIKNYIDAKLEKKSSVKFYKMFFALRDMINPNREMFVVGDADSGRFLYLEDAGYEDTERTFECVVGAALTGDRSYMPYNQKPCDYSAAHLLIDDVTEFPEQSRQAPSIEYADTGFYFLRNADACCFVNCSVIGTGGLGSHSHNDRLEVLLNLHGQDIIIDPGVYAYTASPKYRDIFRNVQAHSTLSIGGIQPNRLNPPKCWWGYHDDTKCNCILWDPSDSDNIRFVGEQHAYERLEIPVTHRRSVNLKSNTLEILDELFMASEDMESSVEITFALASKCVTELKGNTAVVKNGGVTVEFKTENGIWELEDSLYAPVYGAKAKNTSLKLRFDSIIKSNIISIKW